jgi:hypothetical protein
LSQSPQTPTTPQGAFQGTAQAFQTSLTSTQILIAAGILVVYIVLGSPFDASHEAAALSSDHDDDDGGAAPRAANCAWLWGRFGVAAIARHRHRRRTAGVAIPHAAHNPVVDLYLDRLNNCLMGRRSRDIGGVMEAAAE